MAKLKGLSKRQFLVRTVQRGTGTRGAKRLLAKTTATGKKRRAATAKILKRLKKTRPKEVKRAIKAGGVGQFKEPLVGVRRFTKPTAATF